MVKKDLPKAVPPKWNRHVRKHKQRLREQEAQEKANNKRARCCPAHTKHEVGTGRSKMREFLFSCDIIEQAKEAL